MAGSKVHRGEVPDFEVNMGESAYRDAGAEKSYVRKIDFIVLPLLCLVGQTPRFKDIGASNSLTFWPLLVDVFF